MTPKFASEHADKAIVDSYSLSSIFCQFLRYFRTGSDAEGNFCDAIRQSYRMLLWISFVLQEFDLLLKLLSSVEVPSCHTSSVFGLAIFLGNFIF